MHSGLRTRAVLGIALPMLSFLAAAPQAGAQWAAPPASSAYSIPSAQLMQPAELNRLLHDAKAPKPLILQVGSRVMYDQAHIPGSEYAGPGSRDEGLGLLRARVNTLARDRFIVLYCGCCPWDRCPNVGPAYKLLRDMGFTQVKVLYIAGNFGADWVSQGYAVAPAQ